jgi:hypothetical protein
VPPQNFVYWLTFQPDTTERTKSPVAVPKPESRLRFPELALRLPPEREPWMSEDQRMAISDAQVSAGAFFQRSNPVKLLTGNERLAAIRLARHFCVRRTGCLQRLRGVVTTAAIPMATEVSKSMSIFAARSLSRASAEALSCFRET